MPSTAGTDPGGPPRYGQPLDSLVANAVDRLDADLREVFEERAGIIEYDGQLPRAHAECLALIDLLLHRPHCLTGLVVVEIELEGATQWVLTCDLTQARQRLAAVGGSEIAVLDPADVVEAQYGGLVLLGALG